MREKLSRFVHAGRARLIVTVTIPIVAAILVASAFLWPQAEPEYPSEHTPLSLVQNGVKWTGEHENFSLLHSAYGSLSVCFYDGNHSVVWRLEHNSLSNGSAASHDFGTRILGTLTISLNMTDLTGNGVFDKGDFFTLTTCNGSALLENVTYKTSVEFSNPIWFFYMAYSFVLSDATLHAWNSTKPQRVM